MVATKLSRNIILHAILLHVTCDAIVVQTRRASLTSIASLTFASKASADLGSAGTSERIVVPGTGMKPPLKNLIINERDQQNWDIPKIVTKLGSRIGANELSPLQPSLAPFAADNELFYDSFMFGSWEVTSTLKRKVYPYGTQYLPSNSLFEGSPRNRMEKPGDTTSYEMHYFSLSPTTNNSSGNGSEKVDLNQNMAKTKIIADRAFNAKSMSVAYKQLSQVEDVLWDYEKSPTRVTLQFGTLSDDLQPLGERRGEVYINARKGESGRDDSTNEQVFCTSERLRAVLLIPGDVVVSDTETITEYRVVEGSNGDHLKAVSRIAVYLTPNPNSREGLLWQSVGGKAVAFFDYEMDLRRTPSSIGPFVKTPKGFIQTV